MGESHQELEKRLSLPKVLIVEDNLGVRDLLITVLDDSVQIVGNYSGAEEAVEAIRKAKDGVAIADLVITDLGLGKNPLGGTEVVKAIDEKFAKYPNQRPEIIMLTASPGRAKAIYNKPDDLSKRKMQIWSKPFSQKGLMTIVKTIQAEKSVSQHPQA